MTKDYGSVAWPGWNTVRMIGCGSFGAVYEIERDVFGHTEKAALKVISIPQNSSDIEELYNDGYDNESITQRFQSYLKDIVREYALMSEMKGHTNIVYCDDLRYIQHDDGLGWDIFIKMELLTPLPRIFDKKFSERQVLKIALDLCDALIICKNNNVVHRDIKPQNIFVSKDGSYKLGDFGIAKTAERTTSGTKTGTYKYMAPEVYNNQPYGHAADIYSLGMVLYWLLNERRTPFLPLPPEVPTSSDEDYARESRFSGVSIPAPKYGSAGLKRIVLKACAFNPDDRYATAVEMKKDIAKLISGAVGGNQTIQTIQPSPVVVDYFKDEGKTEGVFSRKRIQTEDNSDRTVSAFHDQDSELLEDDEPQGDKKRIVLIVVAACVILLGISLAAVAFIIDSVIKPLKHYEEPVAAVSTTAPEETSMPTVDETVQPTILETYAPTETTALPTEDPIEVSNREQYAYAEALLAEGKTMDAVLVFRALGDYRDSAKRSFELQIQANPRNDTISAGGATVALKTDGTAIATGGDNSYNQWYVQNWDWKNIVSISAGGIRTLALRSDGTVVNAGWSDQGRYSTGGWSDIIAVSAGGTCALGLKSDGTVIVTGPNYRGENDVGSWNDIVAISAGANHNIGLKSDGTVVAAGDNGFGQCDVSYWTDIVAISAGNTVTAGLRADGTVVSTRYDTTSWTDIIAIAAGNSHVVGLKADGTVVAAGSNSYGESDVSSWTDIVAISASDITMGLRFDGTVVAVGGYDSKQRDVGSWSGIMLPPWSVSD